MKIAAFTGGRFVPSTRFRVRQYIGALAQQGIELEEFPSKFGQYPPKNRALRPLWLAAALGERGMQIVSYRRYDAVLFQRELISTLLTWERFCTRPRILDVDDAIWLHRRGGFAGRLAKLCDTVICGNAYLAEYFSRFCSQIHVLPTAVDTERFRPRMDGREAPPIIGWSGTSPNLASLMAIESALHEVLRRFPAAKIRVISDQQPEFRRLSAERVEYVPWSPEVEASALQDLSVGLMPLPENDWSRGKCSFKMLTYMACGVPVVVTPIGMNTEVLALGESGYGARTKSDWVECLTGLLVDPVRARSMGAIGREIAVSAFSVDRVAGKLAPILRNTAR